MSNHIGMGVSSVLFVIILIFVVILLVWEDTPMCRESNNIHDPDFMNICL